MEENVYLYYKKRKKGNKTMECVYVPAQKMLTLKLNDEIDESKTDKLRRKIDNEITVIRRGKKKNFVLTY